MTHRVRFPFRRLLTPVGFVRVPTARVELRHGRNAIEVEMTIDSGADLSMIPYQVGIALGLAPGVAVRDLRGVSGDLPYLLYHVRFRLGPHSFRARGVGPAGRRPDAARPRGHLRPVPHYVR